MKPVMTLKGVAVYSDKKLTAIIDTRIHFVDGSYADVETKEVINRGEGFISLGLPPSESARVKRA